MFLQRKHWPGEIHITNNRCFPSVKIPKSIIIAIGQHAVAQGTALSLYYTEIFVQILNSFLHIILVDILFILRFIDTVIACYFTVMF